MSFQSVAFFFSLINGISSRIISLNVFFCPIILICSFRDSSYSCWLSRVFQSCLSYGSLCFLTLRNIPCAASSKIFLPATVLFVFRFFLKVLTVHVYLPLPRAHCLPQLSHLCSLLQFYRGHCLDHFILVSAFIFKSPGHILVIILTCLMTTF